MQTCHTKMCCTNFEYSKVSLEAVNKPCYGFSQYMCNSVEVIKKMQVRQMFDWTDTLSTSARPIVWQTGKRFRQLCRGTVLHTQYGSPRIRFYLEICSQFRQHVNHKNVVVPEALRRSSAGQTGDWESLMTFRILLL